MSTSNINWDNVDKVVNAIQMDPDRFDMMSWCYNTDCGTVMCIAGWAAYLDGWEVHHATGLASRINPVFHVTEVRPVSEVAVAYFGIRDMCVAGPLFHDYSIKTPEDVSLAFKKRFK